MPASLPSSRRRSPVWPRRLPVVLFALTLLSAGCGGTDEGAEEAAPDSLALRTVVTVLEEAGDLNTTITAVNAAGLIDRLQSSGPFTVFAPTDEAFQRLPAGMLDTLLLDNTLMRQLLAFHVVEGEALRAGTVPTDTTATSDTTAAGRPYRTLDGDTLELSLAPGGLRIAGTRVARTLDATNGVVHVIDSVLVPPRVRLRLRGDTLAVR